MPSKSAAADERPAAQPVDDRLVAALVRRNEPPVPGDRKGGVHPPGVFEPAYVAILFQAYDEACAFVGRSSALGPARRDDIARVIITNARCGLLDPHRLALKAIVKVG